MNKLELSTQAASLRKKFGIEQNGPIDILSVIQSIKDLTLVFYPMGERLSGLCIHNTDYPIIAINSSMSIGRQRFSMAHELYHLYFDKNNNIPTCSKSIGAGSSIEEKADSFASYLLIPPISLSEKIKDMTINNSTKIKLNDIIFLEQYYKVSRQAMLHRLREENLITYEESEKYKTNVIQSAIILGYDDSLYRATPSDKQYGTYGYYINKANELLNNEIISDGKYEELLLTAFRSDLVFGEEFSEEELYD
ncbi:MAG: ImmA/IrrE family metallo-endopeptidase [Pleomorphochaeta sp.]